MMNVSFFRPALWLLLLTAFPMAWAGEPVNVPMTAAHWRAVGDTAFVTHEGFPEGILEVKSGSAVLRGANFHNGTIAFDMEIDPNASGIPSIEFHRRDAASAEEFYLRPGPDCPLPMIACSTRRLPTGSCSGTSTRNIRPRRRCARRAGIMSGSSSRDSE